MSLADGAAWEREHGRGKQEADPLGKAPGEAGCKLDAGKPLAGLMLADFAHALSAVAEVTTFGAKKYSRSGWRVVPDGVSRYTEALARHILAELGGESVDPDSKLLHAAHTAWNALARLELLLHDSSTKMTAAKITEVADVR